MHSGLFTRCRQADLRTQTFQENFHPVISGRQCVLICILQEYFVAHYVNVTKTGKVQDRRA